MTAGTDGDAREPALPVDPSSRVSSIDALRGIALFGVLAINLETEFRVSIFQQFLPHASSQGLSRLIDGALDIFIDMKAFALFSLLFGVGLAIQFERLEATQRTRLLVRRLLVLLAFGMIHLFLIWNGDILAEYALAGLVVLPFLFGPTWLMGSACAMLFALFLLQPQLPTIFAFPGHAWLAEHLRDADHVYANGTFLEVLQFRIREVPAFLPLHGYVFPRTLGLFLLGALSWRMGLFDRSPRVSRWLRPAAALLIGAGLVLTVALAANRTWGPAGTILLALGYAALVVSIEATKTRPSLAALGGAAGPAWHSPITSCNRSFWASCSTAMASGCLPSSIPSPDWRSCWRSMSRRWSSAGSGWIASATARSNGCGAP